MACSRPTGRAAFAGSCPPRSLTPQEHGLFSYSGSSGRAGHQAHSLRNVQSAGFQTIRRRTADPALQYSTGSHFARRTGCQCTMRLAQRHSHRPALACHANKSVERKQQLGMIHVMSLCSARAFHWNVQFCGSSRAYTRSGQELHPVMSIRTQERRSVD